MQGTSYRGMEELRSQKAVRQPGVFVLSHVRLFVTPKTVAHQAPFVHNIVPERAGCHFLSQGIFTTQGLNLHLLCLLLGRWIVYH